MDDAERYRWIRDHCEPFRIARMLSRHRNDGLSLEKLIAERVEYLEDLEDPMSGARKMWEKNCDNS